jgi:hypothetical protein
MVTAFGERKLLLTLLTLLSGGVLHPMIGATARRPRLADGPWPNATERIADIKGLVVTASRISPLPSHFYILPRRRNRRYRCWLEIVLSLKCGMHC